MNVLFKFLLLLVQSIVLLACDGGILNSPYPDNPDDKQSILYSSFSERPRHLDPAKSYNSNEYVFIGQIYEPPFQYHFLKRPYELEPLTAKKMPEIIYFDSLDKILSKDAVAEKIAIRIRLLYIF